MAADTCDQIWTFLKLVGDDNYDDNDNDHVDDDDDIDQPSRVLLYALAGWVERFNLSRMVLLDPFSVINDQ